MRGWLAVKLAGLEVDVRVLQLFGGASPGVQALTPAGMVPYLEHDGARVWESLAIAEYCAELNPALWPAGRLARAHARAIASEMHAGFRALRQAMPMILGRTIPGVGQNPESLADIARITQILGNTRTVFGAGGPYLFGETFGAADAMFTPVVARFLSYQPALGPVVTDYCAAVRAHPLVSSWYDQAAAEPDEWLLEKYESIA